MMIELFEAAFSGVNVAYSVLLLLMLFYWCLMIIGVADLNLFDFDVDVGDVDVGAPDVDAGMDVDTAGDGVGGVGWLAYFNIGEVPIMLYATIVVLVMWVVSVQVNYWLDQYDVAWVQAHRGWIAAGLAIPNLIFGLHVAKFLMLPVKRLKRERVIVVNYDGKLCLVRSLEVNENYGQVEIPTEDSPLLLNARTRGGEELKKGDAATIVEHVSGNGEDVFIVTKADA